MVIQMTRECSFNSKLDIDRVLRKLEVDSPSEFQNIGPFGVFQVEKQMGSRPIIEEYDSNSEIESQLARSSSVLDLSLANFLWDATQDSEKLPASDEFDPLDWEATLPAPLFSHTSQLYDPGNEVVPVSVICPIGAENMFPMPTLSIANLAPSELPSTISLLPNNANIDKLPPEARSLLNYYSSQMIDLISMSPMQKPPWKTIHLPCAMTGMLTPQSFIVSFASDLDDFVSLRVGQGSRWKMHLIQAILT